MIYFIILIALIVLSYRYDYCQKTNGRKFWMLMTLLALILVAGLRYRLGVDSIRYESYYKSMPTLWELSYSYFQKVRFEPGFVVLMSLCKSFSRDFTLFQMVHAVIINCAVFFFFSRNTRHVFFALFLYFIYQYIFLNYEVLREALAISVFLFSWEWFKKGNYLVYYLLVLLAITFHVGASITLLVPLLMLPGINKVFSLGKSTIFISIFVLIFGFLVNKYFFNFVQLMTFSATMVDRANAYSKNALGGSVVNVIGALVSILRFVVYPLIALYFVRKNTALQSEEGKKESTKPLEVMMLMSVYIGLLTIPIAVLIRFNNYFYFFSLLCMAKWIYTVLPVKGKRYRLSFLYWMVVFLPLVAFQLRGQFAEVGFSGKFKNYMVYYPYSSRLNPEEDRNREALYRFYRSW